MDDTAAPFKLCPKGGGWGYPVYPNFAIDSNAGSHSYQSLSAGKVFVEVDGGSATDIYTLRQAQFILRSER